MVELSAPELKGLVSFECGSWDGPMKTSLVTRRKLMTPSWCPRPNVGLIWDVVLELDDDESLHDLAVIHHLLALRIMRQDERSPTESSEGSSLVLLVIG